MSGPVISEPIFSQQELEQALYHAVDITDRCLLPKVLWNETARSILQDNVVSGDGIYLAVEERYVTSEVLSTIRTLAAGNDLNLGIKDYLETENSFSWIYHNVPIHIQIIHRKYEFLKNKDFVFYMAEEYKVPNPFEKYWKARFIVK